MEILLRTLGLSNAADTMVGNAIVRGVSGGERKRVTSAEMLVGPKVLSDATRTSCSTRSRSNCPCSACAHMLLLQSAIRQHAAVLGLEVDQELNVLPTIETYMLPIDSLAQAQS